MLSVNDRVIYNGKKATVIRAWKKTKTVRILTADMEKMNVPIADLVILEGQLDLIDTTRYEKPKKGFTDWEMDVGGIEERRSSNGSTKGSGVDAIAPDKISLNPCIEDRWIGREYIRHGERVKVFDEYGAGLMFVKVRYPNGDIECCMKDWLKDRVDPNSVDPNPIDPNSVDPNSVDPNSVDPNPVDPNPIDPNPVDPNSVDPNPVDPNPVDPNPIDPNSVDPNSVDPNPIDPNHPARGYEEIKILKGGQYRYWRWYENGKKRSKYLGPVKSPLP